MDLHTPGTAQSCLAAHSGVLSAAEQVKRDLYCPPGALWNVATLRRTCLQQAQLTSISKHWQEYNTGSGKRTEELIAAIQATTLPCQEASFFLSCAASSSASALDHEIRPAAHASCCSTFCIPARGAQGKKAAANLPPTTASMHNAKLYRVALIFQLPVACYPAPL